ncbi:MAG TPA: hypothetical protein VJN64_11750 [Terriglobales bacterium]|nr:hypothetical protein [Terriglobales bacterium]
MRHISHKAKNRVALGAILGAAALGGLSFDEKMTKLGFAECGRLNAPLPQGIKQPNTLLPNGLERVQQFVYDTMTVAANTAFPKTTLFLTPQQGSTKNLAQTNMLAAGQLVAPQVLVAKAIRIFVLNNATPTDMLSLFTNVSVSVNVGKKPMFEGTPWMLPAGGGLHFFGSQVGTAPAGSSVAFTTSNGVPDVNNVYSLADPIVINAGENFNVVLNPETAFNTQANTTNPAGTGFTIVFAFEGYLFREIR